MYPTLTLKLSKLSSRLPTINTFTHLHLPGFRDNAQSPLLTGANQVLFCSTCRMGGDGHNVGQPLLSIAFRSADISVTAILVVDVLSGPARQQKDM